MNWILKILKRIFGKKEQEKVRLKYAIYEQSLFQLLEKQGCQPKVVYSTGSGRLMKFTPVLDKKKLSDDDLTLLNSFFRDIDAVFDRYDKRSNLYKRSR